MTADSLLGERVEIIKKLHFVQRRQAVAHANARHTITLQETCSKLTNYRNGNIHSFLK
jgi:hypothetical protein